MKAQVIIEKFALSTVDKPFHFTECEVECNEVFLKLFLATDLRKKRAKHPFLLIRLELKSRKAYVIIVN